MGIQKPLSNRHGDALLLAVFLLLIAVFAIVAVFLFLPGKPGPIVTADQHQPAEAAPEAPPKPVPSAPDLEKSDLKKQELIVLDPQKSVEAQEKELEADTGPQLKVLTDITPDYTGDDSPVQGASLLGNSEPPVPQDVLLALSESQLIERAKGAMKTGDHLRAARYLSIAHEKNPDDPTVAAFLGITYTALEEYDKAEPLLQLAIANNITTDRCGICLAKVYEARKDYESAHSLLQGLISRNPLTAELYHDIALLEALQDNLPAAIMNMRSFLKLKPDTPIARRRLADWLLYEGQNEAAIREWEVMLEGLPTSDLKNLQFTTVLIQAGDLQRAQAILQDIRRAHPDAPVHLFRNLSAAQLREGKLEEAASTLESGLEKYPDDFVLLFNKVCCLSKSGALDDALTLLQELHRREPEAVLANLGDPDLEPLHAHPEAQAWIEEIQADSATAS
jgi:tetratricopeptide (TPR) repeat protein